MQASLPPVPFGRAVIETVLPHREPFLLIDEVLELDPGRRVVAQRAVSVEDWWFRGHFPDRPVMPGVLIVEALAQASAIIAYRGDPDARDGKKLFMFAGIDDARFKRQVVPGDTLILESTFVKGMRDVGKYAVRATVDGQVACEATLLSVLRPTPGGG